MEARRRRSPDSQRLEWNSLSIRPSVQYVVSKSKRLCSTIQIFTLGFTGLAKSIEPRPPVKGFDLATIKKVLKIWKIDWMICFTCLLHYIDVFIC